MRRWMLGAFAAAALVAAAPAAGDGGPGPGIVQGWDGVVWGNKRIVTVPSVGWTSLQVVQRRGGRVLTFTNIRGVWGIPLVAFDGTKAALQPDGRTLLLATQAYLSSRGSTSFALVDLKKMRVKKRINLNGSFSYDALSPDQRYLYLVEYMSQANINQYRVRAYDLAADKLLPRIVSDRRSWETTMVGQPISRASRGGWAYTLYGGVGRPFIHALDTRHVQAVCINLPWKWSPQQIYEYRLRWDRDGDLVVRGRHGRSLVTVDSRELRILSSVRKP
ncbi:MAG TPA: hypothetical protein VNR59_06725 [Gaiellaceae bacterium]|nr:hypothetical protein [Gaiellaceae bacterium]HWJ45785.1 hypothetical protein [Gaiellaceae bacterium]